MNSRSRLKLEALEQRQLLAGIVGGQGGQEVLTNVVHSNGNVYDQVLMNSSTVTVTADAGQVTRVSFLDLQGDIVQAEFSGAGTLTISLDPTTFQGPAEAANYNQPGTKYVQGLASFTIQGSDATTNFGVFSVGTGNAHNGANNPIFAGGKDGGDNTADVARLTIVADPAKPNGSTFGGIRAGNAIFSDATGSVGIAAANVHVQNVVVLSDINATGSAIPTLVFGANSQFGEVRIAGGGLVSDNGKAINNTGSYVYALTLADGQKSDGTADAKEDTLSQLSFTDVNVVQAQVKTFTLTTGVDTIQGTTAGDTINALLNGGSSTLTALDTINGADGKDTLNIIDLATGGSAFPAGLNITNVETATVKGADDVTVNTTTWTGLETLSIVQSVDATVKAGATTAVQVAGATGLIVANGGSTVDVTSTNVTAATTVNIGKGGTAGDLPTGAITVNSTGAASVAATDVTLAAINIEGGTTVAVNQTASSSSAAAVADATGATITQSAVNVTGGASTTTVAVTQSAPVAEVLAVSAIAGSKETNVVTFAALTTGQGTTIGGLTFTASKDLTASQVAAAFANLSAGTTQGSAPAANGVYSGTLIAGWTSGAVVASGANSTVTVTSTTAANAADLVFAGTVPMATVKTDGVAAVAPKNGVLGVAGGAITVNGAITGSDVLATVTLQGFGAGSTITSDALTSLSLAKSNEDVAITNGAATSLGLSLNGVGTSGNNADLNVGATYTSLNVTTTGANSDINITGAGVTALSVAGDKALVLTGSTLAALKTVTLSGSAGVTVDASGGNVTAVDASGSSGGHTITVDASKATYTGGSGADAVTLSSATVSKAVALGAGGDTLNLAAGTTLPTADLDGGDGTDTLAMAAADAQTHSANATFEGKIAGFEKLSVGAVATTVTNTVDLTNVDDISYVVSAGGGATSSLVLNNMADGGTLELTAAGILADVNLTSTTGANTLNVVTKAGGDVAFGTVDAAGIETINLTVTDTVTAAINTATLTLKDAALTTATVTGNAHLTLTLDANVVALTSLNGSAMTGKLTAATNGTVAQTITGGSGADTLTATGTSDVLIGGGGSDTLIVTGNLATLTGGAGTDTFDIGDPTTNANNYATITDLTAGDKIKFAASAANFAAAKITLEATAVFQDYANTAISQTNTGDVSWFQYNGDTYVVQNVSNDGSAFTNNTDVIVKVSGAVDLSGASFSASADTLLIV